jgi:hypothetical protein
MLLKATAKRAPNSKEVRYSEFQARLTEVAGQEAARDPESGLFVVRAVGMWRGIKTITNPVNAVNKHSVIDPFVAVVSSPTDELASRAYAVYMGDSSINSAAFPAFFDSSPALAGESDWRMPAFVSLHSVLSLDLPGVAFVDGRPDTLIIGGQSTMPGPICQAQQLGM